MRFNSIRIKNYRQYRNLEFSFPSDAPCDLHVIIGSNGVGKTNLLNAINWCLYGDEPHTSGASESSQNDKMPICNTKEAEEARCRGDELCPVSVVIEAEDGGDRYTFKRVLNWNVNTQGQSGRDDFSITRVRATGDSDILRFGAADAVIERYLPKKIRKYFYFDGEQLLYYFNPETEKVSHIKDSIYEIAGVNALKRVEDHLEERIKDYRRTIRRTSPDLEKKEREYQDICDRIVAILEEIDTLNMQIDSANQTIADIDRQINGAEGAIEKNRKYNENNDTIEREKRLLADAEIQRAAFVKRYLPMLFLFETNMKTRSYISAREESDRVSADVNVALIEESLLAHKCKLCQQTLSESVEIELSRLVAKYKSNVSLQRLAEIKNDVRRSLNVEDYETDKRRILNTVTEHQTKIDELEVENDALAAEIMKVSDIEGIEAMMDQKEANERLKETNTRKIGSDENELKRLEKERDDKKKAYDDAVDAQEGVAEMRAWLQFTEDAKAIITETKNEIVNDVKRRMEERTMEIFNQLIWKKDTYGHIELNDNFQLRLFHKKTGKSCLASLSASEKELLALAFTIALHQISGYDNLLFIDTPVGRVSDENRRNFASVLLDISRTKEIILAFTPSEYFGEISDVLRSGVVASYSTLRTTDSEDETIKE